MQLEDYFDFLEPDDIRLKGSRIGIETILDDYLHGGMTAEAIQRAYPTLSLEQVYATILFYLHDPERLNAYMAGWIEHCRASEAYADTNQSALAKRLRPFQVRHGDPELVQ